MLWLAGRGYGGRGVMKSGTGTMWVSTVKYGQRYCRNRHGIATSMLLVVVLLGAGCRTEVKRITLTPLFAGCEKKTEIRKSLIPGAGEGLFALVKIRQYEVIGQYTGVLRTKKGYPADNSCVVLLPDCLLKTIRPFIVIDGKEGGSHASMINFAPSAINGVKTMLQNSYIFSICRHPYVLILASRDIEPGEEIYCSYGSQYNYAPFMNNPVVRNYFCGRLKIDCSKGFSYEY